MDMLQKYREAEKLMPWNADDAVLNGTPVINWMDEENFYFTKDVRTKEGRTREYVKVNCKTGAQENLFDSAELQKALGADLPENIAWDGKKASFSSAGFSFSYDPSAKELKNNGAINRPKTVGSPDGKWSVAVKNHNIYLTDNETGAEKRITDDGEPNFAWAHGLLLAGFVKTAQQGEIEYTPELVWSHDSKRFLTFKVDSRLCTDAYYLQTCFDDPEVVRPKLWTCKYPIPSDEFAPTYYLYIYNVETGKMEKVKGPDIDVEFNLFPGYCAALWTKDDKKIYYIQKDRDHKDEWLNVIDTETLETTSVIHEHAEDFIGHGSSNRAAGFRAAVAVTDDGKKVFWWSERDDQGRLFAYDFVTGKLLGPVTPKGVHVESILKVDDENGYIYFMATCLDSLNEGYDDPYFHGLCRASFDGKSFTLLTKPAAEHKVSIRGKYFVDTYSRVNTVPVTSVFSLEDGHEIAKVVDADIQDLLDAGYTMPIPFKVKARDGVTDIYGIVIPPKDLDESKTYPFVEYHYGAPMCWVPKDFTWRFLHARGREMFGGLQSYAHLGIAGVMIDGFGTPSRGHKFNSYIYQNLGEAIGLPDHIAAGPQLKKLFPWLDITRVGIMGNSGGGFGTARALCDYGEYYKVGVSSAGNHDQRLYNNDFSESSLGHYDPKAYYSSNNCNFAKGLKGKLMIVHGMLDDNVMITESMRLIQALIENNKDFDLLVLPTWDHNVPGNTYFVRRKMDYFVKNLLGEEPPKEFEFGLNYKPVV